jgi:late competence protein required for DNA uptake (superfamily II DNA/RNA helicase)
MEEIIVTETRYRCIKCGHTSKNKSYILNQHIQHCGRVIIRKRKHYEKLPDKDYNKPDEIEPTQPFSYSRLFNNI